MLALLLPLTLAVGEKAGITDVTSYEITDVTADSWLTPASKVQIGMAVAKLLTLTLYVPKWMPFEYPAKLQTVRDGHIEQTFEFAHPGRPFGFHRGSHEFGLHTKRRRAFSA